MKSHVQIQTEAMQAAVASYVRLRGLVEPDLLPAIISIYVDTLRQSIEEAPVNGTSIILSNDEGEWCVGYWRGRCWIDQATRRATSFIPTQFQYVNGVQ